MSDGAPVYPARLQIDYPEHLDRVSTLFRLVYLLPIGLIFLLLSGGPSSRGVEDGGRAVSGGAGFAAMLAIATALMIVVRQRYPRWWFDFAREFTRFSLRVAAYAALLTDRYPSTEDEQSVHLELDYPDVPHELNRWMPLIKWLLAIPHYLVLFVIGMFAVLAVMIAWVAILVTGRYPRALFDLVVGSLRWLVRVQAYAFLLVTDRYPPFSVE